MISPRSISIWVWSYAEVDYAVWETAVVNEAGTSTAIRTTNNEVDVITLKRRARLGLQSFLSTIDRLYDSALR